MKPAVLITVFLLILFVYSSSAAQCPVSINEVQLGHDANRNEFIELKKHCKGAVNLTNYTLIMWQGPEKKGGNGVALHKANFTAHLTNCSWNQNHAFFVIYNPDTNTTFNNNTSNCSFAVFNHTDGWVKGEKFWINKGGSKRVESLVLYSGLPNGSIPVNTSLNKNSAHLDNIEDLIFFTKTSTGHGIKEILFPDYNIGPCGATSDNSYYVLHDKGADSDPSANSFSLCCADCNVTKKWPMAFKWSASSPGQENNCSDKFKYVLDEQQTAFPPTKVNRCNITAMENFMQQCNVTPTTSPAPPKPTTPAPHKPTTPAPHSTNLALKVGLPVFFGIVLVVAIGYFIMRRRQYAGIGTVSSWRNCFKRGDEEVNLVQ